MERLFKYLFVTCITFLELASLVSLRVLCDVKVKEKINHVTKSMCLFKRLIVFTFIFTAKQTRKYVYSKYVYSVNVLYRDHIRYEHTFIVIRNTFARLHVHICMLPYKS